MKSFEELQQETRSIHFDFLVTDLNAAHTFLDVAHTTRSGETRERNLRHANAAYDTVMRFVPRVAMSEQQHAELHERLDQLKDRLEAMKRSISQMPGSQTPGSAGD